MANGYWIAVYRQVHDPDKLAAYSKLAAPAIEAADGWLLTWADRSRNMTAD